MSTESPKVEPVKKKSSKGTWYLILFLIILGIAGYGYYRIQTTVESRSLLKIQTESDRCNTFIAQQSGDFGDFEYCKRFIEWAK